jgi:hypothetical protein
METLGKKSWRRVRLGRYKKPASRGSGCRNWLAGDWAEEDLYELTLIEVEFCHQLSIIGGM